MGDHDFLKKMTQPNQVKEQLAQLYRELEETGEAIRPLLEADLTNSCTSSSSNYSTGEECEEFYINTQKQRQVRFERYAIIYGEDAPMPPSLKKPTARKETANSTDSSSGANNTTENKKKSSKNYPEDSSSSLSSTGQSGTSSNNDRQKRSSTSLGSSSAITVDSRPTSDDNANAFGTSKVSEEEKSKPDLAVSLENLEENPSQKSVENLEQKSSENLEEENSVEKTEEDLNEQMSEKEAVENEPLNVESNEGKDKD